MLLSKKKAISELFNDRFDKILTGNRSSKVAYDWLQKNLDKFTGKVFPPLVTQINVKRREYVNFVENSVGSIDMSTFLFEKASDLEYFADNLERECQVRVNMAMVPEESIDNFRPTFDLEQYKEYGIFAAVSDLFTAPEMVMNYLCQTYHLHSIPVGMSVLTGMSSPELISHNLLILGNDKTDSSIERLIDSANFRRIITSRNVYNIVISRYDNEKSTRMGSLNQSKFLNVIIDENEEKKIDSRLEELEPIFSQITSALEELNKKNDVLKVAYGNKSKVYETYSNKQSAISLIEAKIKEKEKQIKMIQNSLVSLENLKPQVAAKLSPIQEKQLKTIAEMHQLLSELSSKRQDEIIAESRLRHALAIKNSRWFLCFFHFNSLMFFLFS